MLNELVESVSAKTGLSQDQSQAAVEAVIGLLKQRLPGPLAEMLGSLVPAGGGVPAGGAANAATAGAGASGLEGEAEALIGNLFGSKKEE
jgi:hypothetical protein